jgi:hypothetical protein
VCEFCRVALPVPASEVNKPPANGAAYDRARMSLADECQTLRDENTRVLAENARLRREIDRTKKGPKR